jgi:flagellin
MSISIGSNTVSATAQRLLDSTGKKLSDSFNKLSSGQRVNSGVDDAAGLAISEQLKAQSRIAGQAIRNTNDGISTIAIADGALGEVANILARLAELASQSASGTLSVVQRSVVQNEFVALGSEIERISKVTEFNGIQLLSGSQSITIQVGTGSNVENRVSYTSQLATLKGLGLGDESGSLSYSINGSSNDGAATASRYALDAVYAAIYSVGAARGALGGVESRLSTAITNLSVAKENYSGANSRIRDIDVAEEAATLTRYNILQQAGTSVLAQANQLPSLALQLLRF